MDGAYFLTIMLMAISSSFAGQLIGQSVTLGPLFLGVIIPGGPPLGTAVVDRLDRLVSELFLPGYLVLAGLRSNLHAVLRGVLWEAMTSFIVVSVAGKVCGVIAVCLYYKMSFREAFVLALILNCRGILEISTLNNLKDFHELTEELYAINIIGIIVVGGISGILLKALYPPSAHLESYRRRTVQACAGTGELRILTCVHSEDHVPSLLTLVNTVSPTASSPLCIYLLHLSPLVGRSHTIFAPYKKKQRSKSSFRTLSSVSAAVAKAAPAATVTDRIVNLFISLARHHPAGLVAIQPFISVSPYATMHDDVCSLAVDKMCDLILIPFHRSMAADVPLESVNPAIRSFNIDILLYAPCSVAILVNRSLSGSHACALDARHTHRVLILFLGGADDREALAIAAHMIDNPSIKINVLRLVPPCSGKGNSAEEEMDDEAVEEFRSRGEGLDRVEYREEEVEEGAETVRLMKEMDGICDLVIVGRGEGRVSPFTSGLEIWSEYPELGVLGDVLASPDFGGSVSVMVVQQRSTVAGDEGGGGLLRRAGSVQGSRTTVAETAVDPREGKFGASIRSWVCWGCIGVAGFRWECFGDGGAAEIDGGRR
ncbi:Cation/H(+) antiporter 15 [Platanthera guangdongensis]|uniref:Cation/H(+) antiporter 15 n=1 Tax=Platanthera guangdongensis TaxID=2320717 RepID=A0ABR2M865_9ASPA